MDNKQKTLANQGICKQPQGNLGITQSSGLDHLSGDPDKWSMVLRVYATPSAHPLPLHPAVSALSMQFPWMHQAVPPPLPVSAGPPAAGAAKACHGAPHGGLYPGTPWRSKSISGAVRPPKSQTSAMRFLRWGTPQNWASKTLHARLHCPPMSVRHPASGHPYLGLEIAGVSGWMILSVSWRTAPKSSPLLELKAPGTFSHTIHLGRMRGPVRPLAASAHLISFITLSCSIKSPERSPASPARLPAIERSWHGLPPMMTQTGSTAAPWILVMSP